MPISPAQAHAHERGTGKGKWVGEGGLVPCTLGPQRPETRVGGVVASYERAGHS